MICCEAHCGCRLETSERYPKRTSVDSGLLIEPASLRAVDIEICFVKFKMSNIWIAEHSFRRRSFMLMKFKVFASTGVPCMDNFL